MAVIVDNAENIKLAVKLAFDESKLLNCFDHTLNLVPKYALGTESDPTPNVVGLPPLLDKVKEIVTCSHSRGNFANELMRLQYVQWNKTEGTVLTLKQDVQTRWGSTCEMICRFLELKEIIYHLQPSDFLR